MTAHRWRNSAGHLIRTDGHHVLCETCPCGCPTGSALYKIKYAERDTSCTSGAANKYRLNISCDCRCLITGTVPTPLPEGKTAADYYNSYPLTGQTGETYWKRTIAGGPFVDDDPLGQTAKEKCDAYQVDGCTGACSWYKIRTAYYDADCPAVNGGYNDTPNCECRCLITGTVPSPIPEGKTAEDYAGSYPITVTGEYKKELFGPYSATCDLSADQVCAAAKIEGCDYAWGCLWDWVNNQPRFWYATTHRRWEKNSVCSGTPTGCAIVHSCRSSAEILNSTWGECFWRNYLRWSEIIDLISGPENNRCDLPAEGSYDGDCP